MIARVNQGILGVRQTMFLLSQAGRFPLGSFPFVHEFSSMNFLT